MILQLRRSIVVMLITLACLVSQGASADKDQCGTYIVSQERVNGIPQPSQGMLVLCPNNSYKYSSKERSEQSVFEFDPTNNSFTFQGQVLSTWGTGQQNLQDGGILFQFKDRYLRAVSIVLEPKRPCNPWPFCKGR
jgi:hypothetical protein